MTRRLVQRYGGTVGVLHRGPGRAFVDSSAAYELRFEEGAIRTQSRMRVDSDAGSYHVRIEIETGEDGELGWSRRWERRIPRNLQ